MGGCFDQISSVINLCGNVEMFVSPCDFADTVQGVKEEGRREGKRGNCSTV